ncbi:response regulator [Massilia sp. YIM B02769]|uniref:ANTAR domain-containing response regulator n=1 Tax=Massilia sp. YIM B02769 TaxID=3050129 RepID=UPI0025B69458|nr:response regulator [Massilia sp. YIM B02769]MDN4061541.1 response regulator [Massilia sp. YIM B02769]
MLKAVLVDSNAISRGLLNTVLTEGSYDVVGQTHTGHGALLLAAKFRPQLICIAREQVEEGDVVEQLRATLPKSFIFMVSGTLDAPTIQHALARGVHGFIVKPFKADAVLKTIRNTVIAAVKKQQSGGA